MCAYVAYFKEKSLHFKGEINSTYWFKISRLYKDNKQLVSHSVFEVWHQKNLPQNLTTGHEIKSQREKRVCYLPVLLHSTLVCSPSGLTVSIL